MVKSVQIEMKTSTLKNAFLQKSLFFSFETLTLRFVQKWVEKKTKTFVLILKTSDCSIFPPEVGITCWTVRFNCSDLTVSQRSANLSVSNSTVTPESPAGFSAVL